MIQINVLQKILTSVEARVRDAFAVIAGEDLVCDAVRIALNMEGHHEITLKGYVYGSQRGITQWEAVCGDPRDKGFNIALAKVVHDWKQDEIPGIVNPFSSSEGQ